MSQNLEISSALSEMSFFAACDLGPVDPILGTALAFRADPHPKKVNLGVGAYRDETAKPLVFSAVKKAEKHIFETEVDKEYSPIDGNPALKPLTLELLFGANAPVDRIASAQTLSGTGALRVAAEFLALHVRPPTVIVSDPTWETHRTIFNKAGHHVTTYPYWDGVTKSLNFSGMMTTLRAAAAGSVVLLHACAHNPTGVDPTPDQWQEIVRVISENKLIPLVDNAYQGYASGDVVGDAYLQNLLLSQHMEFLLCQSFAKNLGLYGERIGMLHVVCGDAQVATRVLSQLKLVIRPMYSSPPIHGAKVVQAVLGDAALKEEWLAELKQVSQRIRRVREELKTGLETATGLDWSHITNQIGMFSFTGLTAAQCEKMISKWHIYLLLSGRISLAGLNSSNVAYVVEAITDCIRGEERA